MEVYQRWDKGLIYVRDLMSKPVRKADSKLSIPKATTLMAKYSIGCLVVTGKNEPVGLITGGDILRRGIASGMDPRETTIGKLMSKPLITTSEDTTIEEAGAIMTGKSVKRLPVLNHRRLSGMITATDIVRKEPVLVRLFDDLAKSKDKTSSKS